MDEKNKNKLGFIEKGIMVLAHNIYFVISHKTFYIIA